MPARLIIALLVVPGSALNLHDATLQEGSPAEKARKLMKKMTLGEKAAQMLQIEGKDAIAADVLYPFVGSVLYEGNQEIKGNTKQDWYDQNKEMQKLAKKGPHSIPMLIGADAVHGQSHVKGSTIFPHNIALGCTRNASLIEEVGKVAAIESAATGVNFMFAPCLDIASDLRWGRTYESFGSDAQLVNEMGSAFVKGAKSTDTGMVTSVKHFVAAGATEYGTGTNIIPQTKLVEAFNSKGEGKLLKPIKVQERKLLEEKSDLPKVTVPLDRGNAKLSQQELMSKHMLPYWGAVRAGTHSVMTSYSSVNGVKMHKNKELLQYLKGETFGGMNFEGFVITDYAGIDMLNEDFKVALPEAINAGIDMIMLPGTKYACRPWSQADKCPTAHSYLTDIITHVQKGKISESRIDDAVFRILKAKIESGVYDKPLADEAWLKQVGSSEHREIARQAVQQATVLLKNKDNALPLGRNAKVCVAGRAGEDLGYQLGGWSVKWQGADPELTPKQLREFTTGTTIWQDVHNRFPGSLYDRSGACKGYKTVIAVVGEPPYAEGYGDRTHLDVHHSDKEMLKNAHSEDRQVILVMMSGRPLWIDDALESSTAAVASFVPGTEGGPGIMDVLAGDVPAKGKLSVPWPKYHAKLPLTENSQADEILFPQGFGLSLEGQEL